MPTVNSAQTEFANAAASHQMIVRDGLEQRNRRNAADIPRLGTPGMKAAADGRVEGVRNFACDLDALFRENGSGIAAISARV